MPDIDKTLDNSNKILQTLSGMPFANMIALCQLLMMGGGLLVAVYILIPSERKAIMDTIQQMQVEHQKQIDRVVEQHTDSIERVTSSFERTLDRVMNRPIAPVASQQQ